MSKAKHRVFTVAVLWTAIGTAMFSNAIVFGHQVDTDVYAKALAASWYTSALLSVLFFPGDPDE